MHATRLLVLAVLLAGCPDRTISEVPVDQQKVEVVDMPAVPRRDLDILFVIDDSRSMEREQAALIANFSRVVEILESIEGGLPDIQIGVITPNLGTTALDGVAADIPGSGGCSGDGEGGRLRTLGAGGPRFLRSVDDGAGGRTTNFSGTLTDAFRQLATVGSEGCGIEQHLEAIKRATDGNPANAGFLRDGAYLAVIIIADEDDCSLAKKHLLEAHRGDSNFGFRTNLRCTMQGVTCQTPSAPFDTTTGPREDCAPSEDPASELTPIDRYVDHLLSLRPPGDIIVAGIIGNPDRFEITRNDAAGVNELASSCDASQENAHPPVRMAHFLGQFVDRSTRASICNADLSGGLVQIAALLKKTLLDPCFETLPLDVDAETPGPQYDCSVIEVRRRPGMPDEELRTLPACAANLGFPCWRIEEDPVGCRFTPIDPHLKLVVDRDGQPVADDVHLRASCVTANPAGPPL